MNNFTVTGYVCSLNPCFNGRCTRTKNIFHKKQEMKVLILVLMEDALVLRNNLKNNKFKRIVLILVLMEDALVRQNLGYALFKRIVRLNCASKDLYLTNFMYLFSEC